MENRYQHTLNGQSVLQADLNSLGEVSALADDRVLAELYRLTPYNGSTVQKGILTFSHQASGNTALVAPNGASGTVKVSPFRAFVGSRTAVATDAKKNWRDIRSAILVGTTTLELTSSIFADNGTGNPRWDLVYAAVTVDANAASVTRKMKDSITKVISSVSVVTQLATTVVLGVQAGTAAASPVWPTVPADAAGVYYIPLAYVRIPNGFGASSTVLKTDIAIVAPALTPSRGSGGASLKVATSLYTLTTAQQQAWGSTGTRPTIYLPSSLTGAETLLVHLDLSNASSASWSHANDGVIDSRDWRGRLVKWHASVSSVANVAERPYNLSYAAVYNAKDAANASGAAVVCYGFGQTIENDGTTVCTVAHLAADKFDAMADASNSVSIRCDLTTGALKLRVEGGTSPQVCIWLWLEFSAPFENAV